MLSDMGIPRDSLSQAGLAVQIVPIPIDFFLR